MTTYEDKLRELNSFMDENGYRTDGSEDDFFQAVLDRSLKYVEKGKDLKDNYARLLTVALYTVNTLDKMITRCQNEGAVEEFQNYRRLINSFDYEVKDVMISYERLRDIYEKLLFSSTYFGFCDYLVDAGPVKPQRT
jgi:hypothetical protein